MHKSLYRKLQECGIDMNDVFKMLNDELHDDKLADYREYAIEANDAEEYLTALGTVSTS